MAERLYRWNQISHWDAGDACRAGELRARCAGPYCDRVVAIGMGVFPAPVPLWILSPRMRCQVCGHRGVEFEVWGPSAAAKVADRGPPSWIDDRRPHGRH